MDRAEERAGPEDVGDQALMRGLDTALPFVRPGLSLSRSGVDHVIGHAGDRRGDDGRPLALPGERPKTPAQSHLRFPGNLAHRPRCGRHLYLLLAANTWRMSIGCSATNTNPHNT